MIIILYVLATFVLRMGKIRMPRKLKTKKGRWLLMKLKKKKWWSMRIRKNRFRRSWLKGGAPVKLRMRHQLLKSVGHFFKITTLRNASVVKIQIWTSITSVNATNFSRGRPTQANVILLWSLHALICKHVALTNHLIKNAWMGIQVQTNSKINLGRHLRKADG